MQQDSNLRNLILAMVAIVGIMIVWQIFIWGPQQKAAQEAFEANQAAKVEAQVNDPAVTSAGDVSSADPTGDQEVSAARSDVRVPFNGASMDGTMLLRGARVDQLRLKDFYDTLEDKQARNPDGEVTIYQPQGTEHGYYASLGWTVGEGQAALADANTAWELVEGSELTPVSPLVLSHASDGIEIRRTVSIDDDYMFTFEDTVTNTTGREVSLQPYGVLRQFGMPADLANFYISHEGLTAVTGKQLELIKYKKLGKGATFSADSSTGGWIGLTTKYWMGAMIPDQSKPFNVSYRTLNRANGQVLQARMDGASTLVAPGESYTTTNRVYGGAKESKILKKYEDDLGIPRFIDAIDWGKFFFWLTKPFFFVLTSINGFVGNFGVSILILTVIVKAVFFPIQSKSYKSMAMMRELTEPMKKIRETVEDKQEQQRQIMALYKEKQVNPVAGCLPVLFQMPVFYGLYKTLFVTIEMRHEPFFLWIHDLSAPDPTAIGNLFGLMPWTVDAATSIPLIGTLLAVGVLPMLYGVTMWALQSLNPPPQDDTQKMIFAFLPLIFTFVFANFAAGLVIYWVWSNLLSILQQYTIMRRHGVKTELDKFIERKFSKKGETGG